MPWSDQPITQVIDRYQSAWFAHRVDAAGNDEQVLTLLKHDRTACISSQKSNSTTELPNRSPPSRRVPTTPLDPPAPKPRTPTPARSATFFNSLVTHIGNEQTACNTQYAADSKVCLDSHTAARVHPPPLVLQSSCSLNFRGRQALCDELKTHLDDLKHLTDDAIAEVSLMS